MLLHQSKLYYFQFILIIFQELNLDTSSKTKFVASKEWQEIQDGQHVPSGLHYRMNLATGKKEAKLMEEDDNGKDICSL